MPAALQSADIPSRMGGGNVSASGQLAGATAQFKVLKLVGAGMCRIPVSGNDYWADPKGTPRPERLDGLMRLAHEHGIRPILLFEYYTRWNRELGGRDKWFAIGKAYAQRFRPEQRMAGVAGHSRLGRDVLQRDQ